MKSGVRNTTPGPEPRAATQRAAAQSSGGAATSLAEEVGHRLFSSDPAYQWWGCHGRPREGLVDFLFATGESPREPWWVFPRLRWGGQFVFASTSRNQVRQLAEQFSSYGFVIEKGPTWFRRSGRWFWLPFLAGTAHYFVARKVELVPPGQHSERFTYRVRLMKRSSRDSDYIVCKEVPSLDSVVERLRQRHSEVPLGTLERRARKFTDKIFPTFLTREAGILKLLQRDLPKQYRNRVPRLLGVEDDSRGFVRRLYMNWLRNGGDALPHLEFARQAADLLTAIHDHTGVIHLDLRLDNMVITPGGVGFVDFGSAVREGEPLSDNPLLSTLFDELMRTSQIQVMLEKMTLSGHVTSHAVKKGYRKIEKAVDFFFLAVQFNSPHNNPDLSGLIDYDPGAEEAHELAKLTQQILRPVEPENPPFRSARDILNGVIELQKRMG